MLLVNIFLAKMTISLNSFPALYIFTYLQWVEQPILRVKAKVTFPLNSFQKNSSLISWTSCFSSTVQAKVTILQNISTLLAIFVSVSSSKQNLFRKNCIIVIVVSRRYEMCWFVPFDYLLALHKLFLPYTVLQMFCIYIVSFYNFQY